MRGRAGEGAGVGAGCWQERAGRAGGSSARARSAGGRAGARARGYERQRRAGRAGEREGGRLGSLGVQLGQVGCFGHLTWFLDPVRLSIFLSHQMNTVHCKINFQKIFFFIKFK